MVKGTKRGATKRPPKIKNVLKIVHECIREERYRDTRHATDRKTERLITQREILQALRQGRHVPSRDRYEAAYGDLGWSYAIEGRTRDNRFLRVIVAFDEETETLFVTAIDLDMSEA
jgi:hypothetical protein